MIWHMQVHFHQSEQETHKAFRLAVCEMEDFFPNQHSQKMIEPRCIVFRPIPGTV